MPIDPAVARMLDRLAPPPLSSGFADRVVAATATRVPPPRRRDRRGPWSRGRQAAFGAMAVALMSATAAAAGLFGDVGVTVPALERFVERVAQREAEPIPVAPPRRAAAVAVVKATPPPEPVVEAPAPPPPPPPMIREARREVAAERIATRIERRIARRERLGLPVDPRLTDPALRPDPALAERFPERAALIDRVQQIRQARREGVPETIEPVIASPPANPGAEPEQIDRPRRLRDLAPAERAERLRQLRELRQRRRELRRQPR